MDTNSDPNMKYSKLNLFHQESSDSSIPNSRPGGFTLIESLIYIAILGFVMVGFISFTLSISANKAKSTSILEVHSNARFIFETISQKVKLADDVVSPVHGSSDISLELDMPSPDTNLLFSLSGGALLAGSEEVTTDNVEVTNLSFQNISQIDQRDSIKVEVTIEYRNHNSKEYEYVQSFETTISLRR